MLYWWETRRSFSLGGDTRLGLRLSDAVHLEADRPEGFAVHHTAAVKHEGRLGHLVKNALVVQSLELIPGITRKGIDWSTVKN